MARHYLFVDFHPRGNDLSLHGLAEQRKDGARSEFKAEAGLVREILEA